MEIPRESLWLWWIPAGGTCEVKGCNRCRIKCRRCRFLVNCSVLDLIVETWLGVWLPPVEGIEHIFVSDGKSWLKITTNEAKCRNIAEIKCGWCTYNWISNSISTVDNDRVLQDFAGLVFMSKRNVAVTWYIPTPSLLNKTISRPIL